MSVRRRRNDHGNRPSDATFSRARRAFWAAALPAAIVAVTFLAHGPAIHAGYVWDDAAFLTDNPLIKARDGLYRFWFTTEPTDYFPLTSTMLWIEWRIWGNRPMPYHVGNILLHALAAVLLWRVLRRLNLPEPAPYLAALIFAVHPVTVASVAWITERKNVLSMMFYLLSILLWLRFEDGGRRRCYGLSLLAAAAAMLAKTSVVMLPFVLLLLAIWRRGRITRRDIARAIPFFGIALVLGLLTLRFQYHALAGRIVRPEPLASRIAAAGWIIWFYLYKIVLPIRLVMVYPRWTVDAGKAVSFVPLALLAACFALLWIFRRSWGRGPLIAGACFVAMLAPVLGLFEMGFMQYSLVSDHLQYAAMPAVIALIAGVFTAIFARAYRRWPRAAPPAGATAVTAILLMLTVLTWRQSQTFRDEETLWSHTIRHNDRAWPAWNNLGVARRDKGDYRRALEYLTRAIALRPDYAEAYNNRGTVFGAEGDTLRAIEDFNRAIALKPDYVAAYSNRGTAYAIAGEHDRAIADLTRAIELRPDLAAAYNNRGNVYANKGDYARAIGDFTLAIRLAPEYGEAYRNRAAAYCSVGEYAGAWADVKKCRRLGAPPPPELVQALVAATGRSE